MKIYTQLSPATLTEQHFQFNPSFGPYIVALRQKMEDEGEISAKFYRYMIKKFQQQPQFLIPFKNVEILQEYDDLVQLLRMSLLPLSANTENYCMALAFMQPSCLFYYTPSFKTTFIEQHIEFDTKEDEVGYLRYFIRLVLQRCYNIDCDDNRKIIKKIKDEEKQTTHYYQVNLESKFIHVHCDGDFPEFREEWHKILKGDDKDFLEMFNKFPSSKFRLEGFCMLTVEDVSKEMATNQLKNAILNMHITDLHETLYNAGIAIGELLNDAKIRIGITPFFKINGKLVYDSSFITSCVGILSGADGMEKGISVEGLYEKFISDPTPFLFPNVDEAFVSRRPYLQKLLQYNIKGFIVCPIITRDGLMGVFELGFEDNGDVSTKTVDVLLPAFPLITDLIYYMIEIFDNKIDRLVKEKFTPLQPSVEWKFNQVAWEYLLSDAVEKEEEVMSNVVFKQVNPLYGAVDIRDSSITRNIALKNDFVNQLTTTKKFLDKAARQVSLPLLDSILFKCEQFISSLTDLFTSEDELRISEFFDSEVVVFLKYLSHRYTDFVEEVEHYMKKMEVDKGEFHHHMRDYETSFKKINKSVVKYFEEEAEKLQVVYPFYFEKFRTDGVEYNIYIGESIVPDQPFDPIYLKNLRLWQVTSMAHTSKANHEMQHHLPLPLQTTQLILVHSHPIDISFRKDERRFDVEGSYNIRYEMLKKRIDKVKIKETGERLTQPCKIAIVYSNTTEVEEYIQHITFLQNKGVLMQELEMLELEDLQGVTGLKALRVGVQF